MATKQGICKNCGSLLVVDPSDELCECVFCDCVFPSAEAIKIFENPDGVEFPNVPQPKRDKSQARHVVTPVFDDVVEKAVKVDKAQNKETKVEKLFEISPDDVTTPKKVKIAVYSITAVCIAIILGISIPLSVIRNSHYNKMDKNIGNCISAAEMTVSTEADDGYATGYKLYGLTNNKLCLVSSKEVEEEQVMKAYQSFCGIRGEEYGYEASDAAHYYDGVVLTVYAPNGRFTIEGNKDGVNEGMIEHYVPEKESDSNTKKK